MGWFPLKRKSIFRVMRYNDYLLISSVRNTIISFLRNDFKSNNFLRPWKYSEWCKSKKILLKVTNSSINILAAHTQDGKINRFSLLFCILPRHWQLAREFSTYSGSHLLWLLWEREKLITLNGWQHYLSLLFQWAVGIKTW